MRQYSTLHLVKAIKKGLLRACLACLPASRSPLSPRSPAHITPLPPPGPRVHAFMASFTDGRDSGLLLITHFTLLLGMAVPVWLSNALHPPSRWVREGDEAPERLWPAALAGITILGARCARCRVGVVPVARC